ncbi:hypothetical protein BVRB_017330 [Beta vulgaris subsp. vulgaris]|uniref:Uncharacterized protein n=1 Tax=Beta vulgaris subsp. vulgaris TaxID=3555 RepID=A0A0J8BG02_BETVV|nr:hypothetical protein BVRB_017330 [Beta vulgaris subsp. vulgaris]
MGVASTRQNHGDLLSGRQVEYATNEPSIGDWLTASDGLLEKLPGMVKRPCERVVACHNGPDLNGICPGDRGHGRNVQGAALPASTIGSIHLAPDRILLFGVVNLHLREQRTVVISSRQ